MSLREAMTDLAAEMERVGKEMRVGDEQGSSTVRILLIADRICSWSREIRTAVKASEPGVREGERMGERLSSSRVIVPEDDGKAEELRVKAKIATESDKRDGFSTAEFADGLWHGDVVEIDPAMPVGASTLFSGIVYTLMEDRKLYFDQNKTTQYRKQGKTG